MNSLHTAIVANVRNAKGGEQLSELSDEQLARRMFSNYRQDKGLRLTKFGLILMRACFKGYEFELPPDEDVKPTHLLFLDQHARLPYYLHGNELVVYEELMAMTLRLIDARLSILVEVYNER